MDLLDLIRQGKAPMLCETAEHPFDNPEWIFEPKVDGVRCLAVADQSSHQLWGRHANSLTRLFPEIKLKVKKPCVLDGEIVGEDFNAIQHRVHRERELDIRIASKVYPCVFEVFDILWLGEDLTRKPLLGRKKILAEVLSGERVRVLPFVAEKGIELFEQMKRESGEGIIAK